MITIHDVAQEAGVSPATVSRALNNHETVGEDYVLRVKLAAQRLGYRPNLVAQTLRTSASDLITLIVPDVYNGFHTAIARAVEDVAQEAGFSVLLGNSDEDPSKEARYLEVSERHRVAGVLLCAHDHEINLGALTEQGIPVVAIDRQVDAPVDMVYSSGFTGAYEAVTHLHQQGWKRIACISGPDELQTHHLRVRGYLEAMRNLQLSPQVAYGTPDVAGGREAALQLLQSKSVPDAFFTVNETSCLGALQALRDLGKSVSSEVGIVSFDDTPWAPLVGPAVTVIDQPAYQIGAQAARMLIERIQTDGDIPPRRVELPTRLIVRQSSKKFSW